jgi:hypothetical protein
MAEVGPRTAGDATYVAAAAIAGVAAPAAAAAGSARAEAPAAAPPGLSSCSSSSVNTTFRQAELPKNPAFCAFLYFSRISVAVRRSMACWLRVRRARVSVSASVYVYVYVSVCVCPGLCVCDVSAVRDGSKCTCALQWWLQFDNFARECEHVRAVARVPATHSKRKAHTTVFLSIQVTSAVTV